SPCAIAFPSVKCRVITLTLPTYSAATTSRPGLSAPAQRPDRQRYPLQPERYLPALPGRPLQPTGYPLPLRRPRLLQRCPPEPVPRGCLRATHPPAYPAPPYLPAGH